ncbi:zf-HC2 domain-containing protein [Pseudomonas sp. P66]|jgi:predicted anti-sigma-YlaC factor YlaD|uniref:Zf-HC2 domain-containing protein n=1 Tax=Pseudomonas arcuscaelestis TaxID=2710591 RepID=A0ABS2C3Z9_9PSED|nr:zf-HC2 domain-containing protein [Pseudomonas arcuscaelestis]MBM3109168.1 zf-HC2 domain-containing protein [Pseudomonas arcuscaelestis]MBM5459951.1 zf-HC2 domain-containing protein [Pseudomonas arcuscaelestis]
MLSCKELVACSSDYLDGQLSLGEKLLARQHLLFCRNCRRFLRQMRVTQATIKAMPEAPVDDVDEIVQQMTKARPPHDGP